MPCVTRRPGGRKVQHMAEVLHLHCRHCGVALNKSSQPYCQTCNIELCYRAMPFLMGMMMTGQLEKVVAGLPARKSGPVVRSFQYDHHRYILD